MTEEDYITCPANKMSLSSAVGTHRVESHVQFSWGWFEVRNYTWSNPVEDIWTLDNNICVFNLALSPRLASSTIAHLSTQKKHMQSIGRVLILPPGSTVRVRAPAGKLRAIHCALNTKNIEDIFQHKLVWNSDLIQESIRFHGHNFEWILKRMHQELRQKQFASTLVAESFANILTIELIRRFQIKQEREGTPIRGGLAPWQMRAVHERAYANQPPPSLAELAERCGITVRHLGRAFKAETGQTVGKFVEAAMIERAYHLLTETNLLIHEVAGQLGFANSASFSYAFHRATGFKPKEIQLQYRIYQ